MLAVVLMLLPVLMTGASLEVPGAGCNMQNCCLVAQCHGHVDCGLPEGESIGSHQHHQHSHDRILLLRDAGLRAPCLQLSAPVVQVPRTLVYDLYRACSHLQLMGECAVPPYLGHVSPLRC